MAGGYRCVSSIGIVMTLIFILFTPVLSAEIYVWVDDNGKKHYTDDKNEAESLTKVTLSKQNTTSAPRIVESDHKPDSTGKLSRDPITRLYKVNNEAMEAFRKDNHQGAGASIIKEVTPFLEKTSRTTTENKAVSHSFYNLGLITEDSGVDLKYALENYQFSLKYYENPKSRLKYKELTKKLNRR